MRLLLIRFRSQAFWLNFPTAMLILILQRTPVVKLATLVEEMIVAAPLGSVLRSAVAVAAGVGVHSIAGATELAASSPSPLAATVGTPVNVGFSITGTLSEPERWFISGSVPPGLSFGGQTSGTIIASTIFLTGTPTTAGSYAIGLQARDDPTGSQTPVYNYSVNVTDPTPTIPAFTTHPQSQTVTAGANVSFTSAATGSPAPTFQWKKGGADIPGATSATLMLNNVQPADAATYTVVATNSAGSTPSNGATLTVQVPPVFTTNPASQDKITGESVTFTSVATGDPAPTYQWLKNGLEITGANDTSYTINSLVVDDAGSYAVRATNAAGSATSTSAILTVALQPTAPAVTSQPPSHSIAVDGSIEFSVAATGNPSPMIQWQRSTDGGTTWSDLPDGGVFSGATTATLRVTKATVSIDGLRFRAVVTNSEGSVTSNVGLLNVAASTGPRLINLSALASAGAGDRTLVMGFFISGTGSKTLLIRGSGPTLAAPPFSRPGTVIDPRLRVFNSAQVVIAENDDWDPSLAPLSSAVGAFDLVNDSADAAMILTLAPGLYTVHLVNEGAVAEGLIEVYDLSRDLGTRLTNLSCRFLLNPGQILIVGTALIGGDVPVLARNIGPGLIQFNIPADTVLADPHMRLYNAGGTEISINDDWDSALEPFANTAGAFTIDVGSKDAALRHVLTPGGFTVHATGLTGGGIAIVELYESPEPAP